ncbi:NAD-dependent epimerase/dehydratase family protein [Sunxiuqinia elliptica]|uniref:Nucleoside-diphosphate-sugar epimerase n=1 Tax=Sunxiuqinia elliptica TaxID=655355 RepID=A0A1I2GL14_9BACT|nr:NAD-dependent epimerase/dehydratase family protein [Sunxiuqinia elliptica]SFF18275.1 Nucleoside-diphosphate-sugar epimerase [Sunxiuqinia elliptica]
MKKYPDYYQNEDELEKALSRPSREVVEMIKKLDGDLIFLGVAGKMGVSMARMAREACLQAGIEKRIIGVSRFSEESQRPLLEESGIETLKGDLLDLDFVRSLPDVENVYYLAGTKFGTTGNESATWAMNAYLPGLVADKYKNSRIVAFSTGCVYPHVHYQSGGSKETDLPQPIGEYAQSCLGRERLFEFGSLKNLTPVSLIRLFYAVEMRYGVLVDIATKVFEEKPIDITMGYVNVIWQGDANAMILRAIEYCESPAKALNITGPKLLSVRETALKFGELMNKKVRLTGVETETALLGNAEESFKRFGKPEVGIDKLIFWTAQWVAGKHRVLGKPTHFENRDGNY